MMYRHKSIPSCGSRVLALFFVTLAAPPAKSQPPDDRRDADAPSISFDAGKLVYGRSLRGDRVLDFSHCGYAGADDAIPVVAVRVHVQPADGDDTARIQRAIDYAATEQNMRDFFGTLSEKDQRRFAALEARQLEYGGIRYVAEVLGCSRRTIERGIGELDDLHNDPAAGRIRRPGAGRPKKFPPDSQVEQNLKSVLQTRTAGDPDSEAIVFTDLSPAKLSEIVTDLGASVSGETIRHWMDDEGLRLRKIRKDLAGGCSPDRDAQFVRIAELIKGYEDAGNPYFSVDTKAKEHLGNLFRAGRIRFTVRLPK